MYQSSASHPLWQTFLTAVKQLIITQKLALPRVFISYAWEGDTTATSWLQERLKRWEADLVAVDLTVFLDSSGMGGKRDIQQTMRENLEKSKVVLAICTPTYALRVQDTKTNVGYEYEETLKKMANPFYEVYPANSHMPTRAQLQHHLASARRFYQRNPFASATQERNRYHHLRNALLDLDELTLQNHFLQYLSYLKGKAQIDLSGAAATQEQIEALRQRLCTALGLVATPPAARKVGWE